MRIDALLWLVFFPCLVVINDVPAQESYSDYRFRTQSRDGFGFQQDRFRWRPLNEEEEKMSNESSAGLFKEERQGQSALYPPSHIDYAETPPGLPPGVYRPVEERHAITPHKDGFRFRTLTPDEQLRIKRRNERYNQYLQPQQSENRPFPLSDGYGRREEVYKFRPEKRLDKRRDGMWGRSRDFPYNPAFTETYQAPMFRPE